MVTGNYVHGYIELPRFYTLAAEAYNIIKAVATCRKHRTPYITYNI